MASLQQKTKLGSTGLEIPRIIFGTSALGNLYQAPPYEAKLAILRESLAAVAPPVAFDSAGKYGAGLALETLGKGLADLGTASTEVLISNKLGWKRVPLTGPEPTFEPGVWKDLAYDAVQAISAEGILECWEQGCGLLGPYRPALVSVHDPDEYLAAATDEQDRDRRFRDLRGAYQSLQGLKRQGQAAAVGIGAKDWHVAREIVEAVGLDWVMLACGFTVYTHEPEVVAFLDELGRAGIGVVNSAVFNAGFLIGGAWFDYRRPDPVADAGLFAWREGFHALCRRFEVDPAAACVEFGLSHPAVAAVALNTSKPERVAHNVVLVTAKAPPGFWRSAKEEGLVARDYAYVG